VLRVSAKTGIVIAAVVFAVSLLGGAAWYYFDRREQAEWDRREQGERDRREQAERIADAVDTCVGCLPERLSMSDEFAYDRALNSMDLKRIHITTVRRKLIELRAYCKGGVLYDGESKKIVFHQMREWGAAPFHYEKLLDEEREKLSKLEREGFTVVRMWQTREPA
jgi:hypothetical protein